MDSTSSVFIPDGVSQTSHTLDALTSDSGDDIMPGTNGFSFSDVTTMVKEQFEPVFFRTFVRNNVFMELVKPQQEEYKEKDITWKVYYSGNPAAGSYAETDDIGIDRNDLGERFDTARLGWKLNGVPIKVSGLAQAVSQSPSSIIDAVGENTEQALKQLQYNMNLQSMSDGAGNLNGAHASLKATGTDLTGIQAMIDDGSSVANYASIDRSVKTWWKSHVMHNPLSAGTVRPISELLIHQMLNEIRAVRQGKTTHILCSPAVFTEFGLLLGVDRRYTFSPAQSTQPLRYIGGFESLMFNDIPIVSVPLYQENRMDFIDIELLKFRMLLDFTIEPRDAANKDAQIMHAKTYSQLQYKNPWSAGSVRDIQTS